MVKPENSLYLHRYTNRIKVAVETMIALLIRHKKGCWAKLFVHNRKFVQRDDPVHVRTFLIFIDCDKIIRHKGRRSR